MIKIGDRVKCRISGRVGKVIGRAEYLYESNSVWVMFEDNQSGAVNAWLSEAQVEVVEPLGKEG